MLPQQTTGTHVKYERDFEHLTCRLQNEENNPCHLKH